MPSFALLEALLVWAVVLYFAALLLLAGFSKIISSYQSPSSSDTSYVVAAIEIALGALLTQAQSWFWSAPALCAVFSTFLTIRLYALRLGSLETGCNCFGAAIRAYQHKAAAAGTAVLWCCMAALLLAGTRLWPVQQISEGLPSQVAGITYGLATLVIVIARVRTVGRTSRRRLANLG